AADSPAALDRAAQSQTAVADTAGMGTTSPAYAFGGAPPTVQQVDTDPTTVDGALTECETVNRQPVRRLLVRFDTAMFDPAGDSTAGDVTNPDGWLLVRPGADASFSTTGCDGPSGDDEAVAIASVTYDDATATAVIDANRALEGDLYRLFACGTGPSFLRDLGDNPLDGDGDGVGGDDFLRGFRSDPDNQLANGHFDCGLDGWLPTSTLPQEITYAPEDDVDSSADSGSVAVENLSTSTFFSIDQCVATIAERDYELRAAIRMTTSAIGVLTGRGCENFSGPNCTGDSIGGLLRIAVLRPNSSDWASIGLAFPTFTGTVSTRCIIDFDPANGVAFDARIDRVELLTGNRVFEDDFESGDTGAWFTVIVQP
ncbi:MAG: hypothetical protein AAF772_07235, partial [Acidobacteriota bacterium]